MALEVPLTAPLPGLLDPIAQLGDECSHTVAIGPEQLRAGVDVRLEAVHQAAGVCGSAIGRIIDHNCLPY